MNGTSAQLDLRSRELRKTIIGMLESAGRGHIASALSVMEIVRVLYDDILRYNPSEPRWPGRDRFILSKGHGCMALYAILVDKGFFPASELQEFCKPDGMLGGHPEFPRIPGVEFSTGSLGHGLPIGCGIRNPVPLTEHFLMMLGSKLSKFVKNPFETPRSEILELITLLHSFAV